MAAFGMPPIFSVSVIPVRPLGKSHDYDNGFDRLLEECRQARTEGVLDVISTYVRQDERTVEFGRVSLGGYPLQPSAMLWFYRTLAEDNEFLLSAIQDESILNANTDYIRSITIANAAADGSINDVPATPLIQGDMVRPELRTELTDIARARLAAVIAFPRSTIGANLLQPEDSSPTERTWPRPIARSACTPAVSSKVRNRPTFL
jgi:hypothetical protein